MRARVKYASFQRKFAFWVRLAKIRSIDESVRASFIEGFLGVPINSFVRLNSTDKVKERVAEMAATDLSNPKYKAILENSWILSSSDQEVFDNIRAYVARAASRIVDNVTVKNIEDRVPDLAWPALFMSLNGVSKPVAYSAGTIAEINQIKSPSSLSKLIGLLAARGINQLSLELHRIRVRRHRNSELAKVREQSLSGDGSEADNARLRKLEQALSNQAEREIHLIDQLQVSQDAAKNVVKSLKPLFERILSKKLAAIAVLVFTRMLVKRESLKTIRTQILNSEEVSTSSWANMMNTIIKNGPKVQAAIMEGLNESSRVSPH